ncbi:MAG: cytochrome c3 family protein [Chloroflexi bacterium]|nr:cytochrome c3 family protein [Chloroflexota bacterium]
MRRTTLVVLVGLGLAGLIAFVTVVAPRLLASQLYPAPQQPLYFDHRIHVELAAIDCTFCHRTATQGITAGYPDLQQCMFCHVVVGKGQPEIEKVRQAWVEQQPINWTRIHRVPDHVHFVHEAHLRAELTCATCHGEVGQMGQVTRVRPLNMNDCVSCHRQLNALTECATCHY